MAKKWRVSSHDPGRIEDLRRASGVSAVLAQILINRGLDGPAAVREFLEGKLSGLRDPESLPGASQAAAVIHEALAAGRRIVVYGDYDVDGMTATALLWRCLKLLGGNVGYHVPNRMEDGYGLNHQALETLADRGAELIVTVDCGVTGVAEAETARRRGMKLVITDHHAFGERLPDADAIVHPRLPGGGYPFDGLSGSGVALKVAWAVCQQASQAKKVSERMRSFLLEAVGLAALGTIGDVVPLVDENRILVRHGLASLKARSGLGLAALMKLTELDKKSVLTSEDIGFTLAPRLNAAGRLGQAQLGVELLMTEQPERAQSLAEYIHELNNSRQSLERSIYLAASKQATESFDPEGDSALVLAERGWHPGVIGIVASRLVEKFHRPVVLVALDELGNRTGIGSARSVPGFDLAEALAACGEHLASHGGHAMAAGLRIEEPRVAAFRQAFCECAAIRLDPEQRVAELNIDAETPLSAFTHQVMDQLALLEPFGEGNRRPLMCTGDVRLAEPPKRIGGGGRHLSVLLQQQGVRMRAVAFGQGDWADELSRVEGPFEIAFRPVVNEFRGRRSIELQLADWRVRTLAPTL